ncbi:hypothetical protein SteCoe_2705 [Stentor coeruleus]|uniref:Uncharacterized protein n=1 Tax=Stentor coeruleus TaxID=5963 RepID=A0A1R2CYY7_9CILI|nr:hypothetical protein SteCoe_2705 [Stentor coeruleus]
MDTHGIQFSRLKTPGIDTNSFKPSSKVESALRRLTFIKNSSEKNLARLEKINYNYETSAAEHFIHSLKEKIIKLEQINNVKSAFAEEYIKKFEEGGNISEQIHEYVDVYETQSSLIDAKIKTLEILAERKISFEKNAEDLRTQYLIDVKEEDGLKKSIDIFRGKITECLVEKNAVMKMEGEREIKDIEDKFLAMNNRNAKNNVVEIKVIEDTKKSFLLPLLSIVIVLGLIKLLLLNN